MLDWLEPGKPDYGVLEMPGRVVSLSSSGDDLWAVCYVEHPWWKFWKPRTERVLVWFKMQDGVLVPSRTP